ncbi:transmembrane protein 141 isoform X11 [Taeniopygia guttata]
MARQKLPYSPQWSLLLAAAAGSLGSYVVTRAETQKCSNFWIYLETGKSLQELAVTGGVSQPAGSAAGGPTGDELQCCPHLDPGSAHYCGAGLLCRTAVFNLRNLSFWADYGMPPA